MITVVEKLKKARQISAPGCVGSEAHSKIRAFYISSRAFWTRGIQ